MYTCYSSSEFGNVWQEGDGSGRDGKGPIADG